MNKFLVVLYVIIMLILNVQKKNDVCTHDDEVVFHDCNQKLEHIL
nr:hypothetical protein BAR15_10094 [Bartonella sp. AR 15-3]